MKKFFVLMTAAFLCIGAYAQTSNSDSISIPSRVESYVLDLATDFGVLTISDKEYIIEHNVIDKVLHSCLSCNPSKVVDTVAQAMVDAGKVSDIESARKSMVVAVEQCRRDDSFWDRVYKFIGLK